MKNSTLAHLAILQELYNLNSENTYNVFDNIPQLSAGKLSESSKLGGYLQELSRSFRGGKRVKEKPIKEPAKRKAKRLRPTSPQKEDKRRGGNALSQDKIDAFRRSFNK